MPLTVQHVLTATTPDDPAYEIKPSDWNNDHSVAFVADATEVIKFISAGTQSVSSGTVVFSNANGVTFGMNAGTITGSIAAGVPSPVNFSAGTRSADLGSIVFNDANGISFGLGGVNSSVMTASHNGLTTARASNDAIGLNTALTANGVSMTANSSGLSLNFPAFLTTAMQSQSSSVFARTGFTSTTTVGTAPTGTLNTNGLSMAFPNVLTTARASNDAVGLNTAQTNVTWTVNSAGISMNAAGYAGTGFTSTTTAGVEVKATQNTAGLSMAMPNFLTTAALSADSSKYAGTTTGFAGANISGSMTMNTAGLNLSLSVAAPGGGGGTLSMYANSNTTQSSSGTANITSLNFAGAGIASVGITNGSVVISVPAGGGAGDGGNIVSMLTSTSGGGTAGATFSNSTASIGLMAGSNITLSQTSNTIVFNAPNSSSIVGSLGINISTAGNTISIQNDYGSYFANANYIQGTQTQTVGQSTSVAFPFFVDNNLSLDRIRMMHSVSVNSTSFASTANSAYSYNMAQTFNFVIYSRGAGASSLSLASIASTSVGLTMSINCSQNTTNNISVTHGFTFPVSNGTQTLSFSYAATNSSMQVSTTHLTALTAVKIFEVPFATTLKEELLWMMYGVSTNQTTQGTANLSGARLVFSHIAVSQVPNAAVGAWGSAANASIQIMPGLGSFTTAGGGTTASLGQSNISSSGSHNMPLLTLLRYA